MKMQTWEDFLEEVVPELKIRLDFIGREKKGIHSKRAVLILHEGPRG